MLPIFQKKKIVKSDDIFKEVERQVENIFDDVLEYEIEIDDKYIVRDQLTKYLAILSVFLLCVIGLWIYIDGSDAQVGKRLPMEASNGNILSQQNGAGKNKPVDKIVKYKSDDNSSAKKTPPETKNIAHIGKKEPKKVLPIVKKEKKKWKWEGFCSKYSKQLPKQCYKLYIEKKCKQKYKFRQSYLEFIENSAVRKCKSLKGLSEIRDDVNLKDTHLNYNFF